MKILHLATDNKFLDYAIPVFESVFPSSNDVFVFSDTPSLRYVKCGVDRILKRNNWLGYKRNRHVFEGYDVIVCHSLARSFYRLLRHFPNNKVPIIWLGWGYDYYDLISSDSLLLPKTQALQLTLESNLTQRIRKAAKLIFELTGIFDSKINLVKRIKLFAPVLPNEYEMVKSQLNAQTFPCYARWNYGTIEDNLVKGFESEHVSGNDILVGNSASFTSNHIEAFDILLEASLKDRQIIAPLSYGNDTYKNSIEKIGREYFGEKFISIVDFMPIDEYIAKIKNCGFVIMNHVRQQALGNIVIMLYLGARIFLREANPTTEFLRQNGVIFSTIEDLMDSPSLLDEELNETERTINRSFVSSYWSRSTAYANTRMLIEQALDESS